MTPKRSPAHEEEGRADQVREEGRSQRDRAGRGQVASLLLGYPDDGLLERRPLLRRAVAGLPASAGTPLGAFLDHLDAAPLPDLESDYVATFDHRKRCCLYLSYYAYGDTRKRGMALLRFKQAYARGGGRPHPLRGRRRLRERRPRGVDASGPVFLPDPVLEARS